ncbi:MAG: DEAD/DEAH box helicase family protein [Bdellovibrionales bacterium]|nr:DEAD/DEAH box helicase family protein [Bdellovibrionales bacterium]
MARELYVYSTERYLRDGLVKVGMCEKGRHKTRIREQFGTSNPEQPLILWVRELPDTVTDKVIHAQLLKNGINKADEGVGTEWFYAQTQDIKLAYNQVVFGKSRTESYPPRKEQQEAVDKARKWFYQEHPEDVIGGASHNRFLLNAKMRFGKCYTGLLVAKELNAKNTIVVTYKPEVISEWMEAANTHVAFDGWMGIRARKNSSIEPHLSEHGDFPIHDGEKVLCVSLQDLSIDKNGNTKVRLEKVVETVWDLIIFDEVHFGSGTDRAKHIIESLKTKYRLDLSGTPFRLIQQDDFRPQQVFTYSYLDEMENKKIEIEEDPDEEGLKIYREMPNLNINTIEITEEDLNQQRDTFLTDDLDFSLNELFKANKSGFIYEDAVDYFIDGLTRSDHQARAISVFGKLGSQLGCPPTRHSVWWLNRVDSVNALVKKLKKHPYFSKFEIINASGASNSIDDDDEEMIIVRDKSSIESAIKKVNEDPTKLGTITLTVRRFLTGVTIREWDSILVLNDGKSAESYYQSIFRVQSAWVDKKTREVHKPESWVFDFAISRCLRITHEYAKALADQLDQQDSFNQSTDIYNDNLTATVQGLCDTLSIKRFYEGSLVSDSTSAKDIFEALNLEGSRIALAKRITSDVLVNFGSLKLLEENPHLYDIIKKIKGYRTQDVGTIEDFVQIGIDADKLKDKSKTSDDIAEANEDFVEKEKDKEVQTRKKWYATQIKRLAICMADFIYMTYVREYNIQQVIHTKEPHFFEVMTGITKDEFQTLCEYGFINTLALNRIVWEFKQQEETSLRPDEYIYESLMKLVS